MQFDPGRDRGPFTVEGSRSAAGAVATWMIARSIGFTGEGYGRILARTIEIRRSLEAALRASGLPVQIAPHCESNILCFAVVGQGEALSVANERTRRVAQAFSPRKEAPFYVSMTTLRRSSYGSYLRSWFETWKAVEDRDEVVLVRLCLMNPFFDSLEARVDYKTEFIAALSRVIEVSP